MPRKPKPRNTVERADLAVAEALAPIRKSAAVKTAGPVAELGDQPPLYAISGAVIAAGLVMDDPRTMRAGARMMAAHAFATFMKGFLKRCIDRTRPWMVAEKGTYVRGKGRHYDGDYNSFPSGHTASSIAVARAVGREYPGLREGSLAAAGSIAILQVIRSKHFATDIAAGAAIGLLAEQAVHALFLTFHPDVAEAELADG